ncbi:MAG: NAD(P)/FAD-dependent oxidoreductase [Patescibacteria group bacterium]
MYDLVIIGGGPAGITAGIYAARKKLKTLMVAKDLLGQTGEAAFIENWPGESRITGTVLMNKFEEHLKNYDINIEKEAVVNLAKNDQEFILKTEDKEFKSKAVIVSSGRKPKRLGVPGENEFVGKGVVYCTTCDAPFFEGKKVIVAGGGDAGVKSAIELTGYAKEVFVFEATPKINAEGLLVDKAKDKGVEIFLNREIEEIRGGDFVEEVIFRENKEKGSIKVDGVFVQIGSIPITGFLSKGLVEFNDGGEIKVDSKNHCVGTDGLFAAGDVTDVPEKQIVIAAGEGAKASLSAYKYLKS